MAIVLRQCRQLPNLFWKNPQVFFGGIQRVGPKSNFLPATWNLGKTLVTSRISFKSDNDKSKSKVNQNEIKISENEEDDESLIIAITKKKKHPCPHCHKSYSSNFSLKQHIKDVHLGLKPFKCDDCGKSFSRKSSLKTHIKDVHLKLKPFECDVH